MRVERIGPGDTRAWDTFAKELGTVSPFSHAGWRDILQDCFNVTPCFLRAISGGGATAGILPLYYTASAITGPHVTTLDGGAFARDQEAVEALYAEAGKVSAEMGARYLLARGGPMPSLESAGEVHTVWTVVDTSVRADAAFSRLSSNTRRKIRKAEKEGYTVALDNSAVDDFYGVYARNVRDLGTPVMGPCLFRAMTARLGGAARLYALRHQSRVIGGMLAVCAGDTLTSLYVAVGRDHLPQYATYLLYWKVIEQCCGDAGLRRLDLGRSVPDSGTHEFKRQWGGEDVRVPYRYYFTAPSFVPRDIREEGGLARALWKRLPLPIANAIGPLLRRGLPFA